ncbi:ABC transporter ATP-binding protein [Mesorhizobium sp. B3-1-3]|uniref:ABC transporter ATP-binding protein n=1 Tax=unclassified Mesorhizobium TaxID=325217 RepID=UPI00112C942D|nr:MULTISPECIES: ABC transporter ATP-binding protein [unclassified Mesorhizobium]TPI57346.1 ABC transporter ATP-binding protein [Mesorhizobium sp. B3-1-8]TPI63499.1 ABC transporter ATP-binding protein [Mesorhizobium sp. B3-1-3]
MSEGVELSSVSVTFGSYKAVDDVSIRIRPGEFFSFLGPSGCGKTTILRAISGFITPSQGVVSIGGRPMTGIGPNKRPTALIFQNLALFPLMPVWENIAFGLEVRGVSKADRRNRAEELLQLVDLPDAAGKAIGQLSGGQKQRVAIARALAVEPKVMLLDEPLSALDLKLRQHMRHELRSIQKRTNITFIYITHDQGEALAMSDRIGVMSRGKLQQVGTPEQIYETPDNGFVASFVGENNVFSGKLEKISGALGAFRTQDGTMLHAKVGPGVTVTSAVHLYIRPQRIALEALGGRTSNIAHNELPVVVQRASFEGNFVNVFTVDHQGSERVVQVPSEKSASIPAVGSSANLVFSTDKAIILADDHLSSCDVEAPVVAEEMA